MNDTTTLAQQMVAAAQATPRTTNLSTDLRWIAVIRVRPAMFRSVRKHVKSEGF
ncbi:hypothetical protein [Hymenobacter perfusus]|uniref:hypothetical protein n=1 Tax=Hymenobacter perfusus TaxID=1236770 RepID=UPI0014778085|nr:hypothetical protein [Hymenobacter perfusus]